MWGALGTRVKSEARKAFALPRPASFFLLAARRMPLARAHGTAARPGFAVLSHARALFLRSAPTRPFQARCPPRSTRRALLLFAAATPASALATYAVLLALPLEGGVGVAFSLLFSGGSVLYAACVHILPSALPLGGGGGQAGAADGCGRWLHLAVFSAAMLAPLLLAQLPDA